MPLRQLPLVPLAGDESVKNFRDERARTVRGNVVREDAKIRKQRSETLLDVGFGVEEQSSQALAMYVKRKRKSADAFTSNEGKRVNSDLSVDGWVIAVEAARKAGHDCQGRESTGRHGPIEVDFGAANAHIGVPYTDRENPDVPQSADFFSKPTISHGINSLQVAKKTR